MAADVVGRAVIKITGELDQNTGPKIAQGFKKALIPAISALGAFGVAAVQSIHAASDLNEQISKSSVIFGKQSSEIRNFANEAAQSLGLSSRAALDASSNFGIIAQGAGLSGRAAVDFSKQFTTLAGDLASFSNTSTDEAITAIGAALRGEAEPIRRYGVLLDDATLRQQALKMGLISTTKDALTPQQRALAASQVILKQTAKAQGDFARTSSGAANQGRILAATSENLKAKLGAGLLPTYVKLQQIALKTLDWMKNHQTAVKTLAAAMAGIAVVIVGVNVAMAALALNPVTLTIIGVVGALALLALGFRKAWEHSALFRSFVAQSFDAVVLVINAALWAFQQLFAALGHVPGFGWATRVSEGIEHVRNNLTELDKKVTSSAENFKKLGDAAEDETAKLARMFVLTSLPEQVGAAFSKLPKRVQLDFSTNVPQTIKDVTELAGTIKNVKPAQIKAIIDASGVKTSVADIQKRLAKEQKIKLALDPTLLQRQLAAEGVKISQTEAKLILSGDPTKFNQVLIEGVTRANRAHPEPKLDLDRTVADSIIAKYVKDANGKRPKPKLDLDDSEARRKLALFVADSAAQLAAKLGGIFTVPGRNASGTQNWRGGLTWVGERGPELIDAPKGTRIYSNEESERKAGASTTVTNNFNLYGPNSLALARREADAARRYGARFGAAGMAAAI